MTTSAQDPDDEKLAQRCQQLLLAVQSLDRETSLTIAGHPCPTASTIGDIAGLSAIILPAVLKIEARDVPWLHAGSGGQCCGAKVYRCNRQIVTVPCFKQPVINGICCMSCSEIFNFSDEDGNYDIKKTNMPSTKARYRQGGGVAFWKLPSMLEAAKKFQKQVDKVSEYFRERQFEQTATS